MKDTKADALMLLIKGDKKTKPKDASAYGDEHDSDGGSDEPGLEEIAQDLIDGVKADDCEAVCDALRAAFLCLQEEYGDDSED